MEVLDRRQIRSEISANFSVERVVFSGFFLSWLILAVLLCFQGFGIDTDAWLMARTAALLRAGEAYDPARSFGNPGWEFLLALIQPDLHFVFSNFLNLTIALLFLWRIRKLFSGISTEKYLLLCLLLCCTPLFTEAASSSMEFMPAWYLWLECQISFRRNREWLFTFLFLLLCLMRLEFFYLAAPWLIRRPGRLAFFIPGFLAAFACIFYSWGKNPVLFSNWEQALIFYGGRLWFLIRQAGLLLPMLLFVLMGCFRQKEPLLRFTGLASLVFFCVFPFEWAYVFPAFFSGLLHYLEKWEVMQLRKWLMTAIAATIFSNQISPSSGLTGLFLQRKTMLAQFRLADVAAPDKPSLLQEGATFLPTNYNGWDRSMQNRLFRRKGSQLFVAEKLSPAELDSFRRKGFEILRFSGKTDKENWLIKEKRAYP